MGNYHQPVQVYSSIRPLDIRNFCFTWVRIPVNHGTAAGSVGKCLLYNELLGACCKSKYNSEYW